MQAIADSEGNESSAQASDKLDPSDCLDRRRHNQTHAGLQAPAK